MKVSLSVESNNTKNILTLISEAGYTIPCNCNGSHHCNAKRYSFDCSLVPKEPITVDLPDDISENINSVSFEDYPINKFSKSNCILVDIGTTTIAIALINTANRQISQTLTFANPQRKYGQDVMARIKMDMLEQTSSVKNKTLTTLIQSTLEEKIKYLIVKNQQSLTDFEFCYIAGNTTMIHLLFGMDTTPLSAAPFSIFEKNIASDCYFKNSLSNLKVIVAPWISAFLGGDITSGINALSLYKNEDNSLFIDLGTNGEIILNKKGTLYGASTSAGPALEGGNISCGSPAIPGAISKVSLSKSLPIPTYETIDNKPPVGICGSGILSLMSQLIENSYVSKDGILTDLFPKTGIPFAKYRFTADDFRQAQLAVAAIGAGIDTLLKEANISVDCIDNLYLAGGFGFFLDAKESSVTRIFSSIPSTKVTPVGNTSLKGLYNYAINSVTDIVPPEVNVISLAENSFFEQQFINHMTY